MLSLFIQTFMNIKKTLNLGNIKSESATQEQTHILTEKKPILSPLISPNSHLYKSSIGFSLLKGTRAHSKIVAIAKDDTPILQSFTNRSTNANRNRIRRRSQSLSNSLILSPSVQHHLSTSAYPPSPLS